MREKTVEKAIIYLLKKESENIKKTESLIFRRKRLITFILRLKNPNSIMTKKMIKTEDQLMNAPSFESLYSEMRDSFKNLNKLKKEYIKEQGDTKKWNKTLSQIGFTNLKEYCCDLYIKE